MKVDILFCDQCDVETEYAYLGMVPSYFVDDTGQWTKAMMCTQCGGLTSISLRDDDYENAVNRYAKLMDKYGIMDEEEVLEEIYE